MKIGDMVKVQKYHYLRPGTGRFFKKQLVNKMIIDIDDKDFAVIHKTKYETVKMWYRKEDIK